MKITDPAYQNDDAARAYLETLRWPNGPTCPHCGAVEGITTLAGKASRPGLYQCNPCHGQFTATVGTIFERSKIPLHKWLLGFRLMAGSKKGISAHQLHRTLGITYKSAWFMAHRIREAMGVDASDPKLGGGGGEVEIDTVQVGKKADGKQAVGIVERGGRARIKQITRPDTSQVWGAVIKNVDKSAHLKSDSAQVFRGVGMFVASVERVDHSKGEYVRGSASTNQIDGFFGVLKRGLSGTYQKPSRKHLDRYLQEFAFRHSNRIALGVDDSQRAEKMVRQSVGKRLEYRNLIAKKSA